MVTLQLVFYSTRLLLDFDFHTQVTIFVWFVDCIDTQVIVTILDQASLPLGALKTLTKPFAFELLSRVLLVTLNKPKDCILLQLSLAAEILLHFFLQLVVMVAKKVIYNGNVYIVNYFSEDPRLDFEVQRKLKQKQAEVVILKRVAGR